MVAGLHQDELDVSSSAQAIKRRAVKRTQRVSPKAVRGWLGDEGRAAGPAPRPRR
jgi:hypothetical protein